jgi:hypothetical protein
LTAEVVGASPSAPSNFTTGMNMATYPIEDLREIHKIWKGVNVEFDPKIHTIAHFIERLNVRIREMNVVLAKYFG